MDDDGFNSIPSIILNLLASPRDDLKNKLLLYFIGAYSGVTPCTVITIDEVLGNLMGSLLELRSTIPEIVADSLGMLAAYAHMYPGLPCRSSTWMG